MKARHLMCSQENQQGSIARGMGGGGVPVQTEACTVHSDASTSPGARSHYVGRLKSNLVSSLASTSAPLARNSSLTSLPSELESISWNSWSMVYCGARMIFSISALCCCSTLRPKCRRSVSCGSEGRGAASAGGRRTPRSAAISWLCRGWIPSREPPTRLSR